MRRQPIYSVNPGIRHLLLLGLFLLSFFGAQATHIVGAELYYECVDPNTHRYKVTLRMFRDCLTGEAPFDDVISLFVFESNSGNLHRILQVPRPAFTPEIDPEGWDTCTGRPYNLCIEEGVYTTFVNLPPIPGGYDLGWARCCRNANITNLFNPLAQGVTFSTHVPGTEINPCNNSAVFTNTLPVFICVNETFVFDHSAIDPDGDSLVYQLSNPFNGLNFQGLGASNAQGGNRPPVVDAQNRMGPPPYQTVSYAGGGFNPQNPFGPFSATIDQQSGWLTFSPTQIGVYVVAISVLEYRNGVLISENKKDFQIHVIPCLPFNDPPNITHDFGTQPHNGDTVFVDALNNTCYTAIVRDTNFTDSLGYELISAIFTNGNPAPTVSDSGGNPLYLDICWEPNCNYVGDTVRLVIAAFDIHACPNHNWDLDTVFIAIQPPPITKPVIGYDLSQSPSNLDTIILPVDSSTCFDWWVTDTLGHNLSWNMLIEEVGGAGSTLMNSTPVSFQDSIAISTCWTASCNDREKLYRVILMGSDENSCPPGNQAADTIYVRVPPTPNPPPVIYHDLSGNVFNQDTIILDVHDTLCYEFVLNDTFPAVNLTWSLQVEDISGNPAGGPNPNVTIISQNDSIVGDICWNPNCDNVNGVFRLIINGRQENQCLAVQDVFDTVYVRVNEIFNPPPIISHTFQPGSRFNGDTLYIAADSVICYDFSLRDTVYRSFLSVESSIRSALTGNSTGQNISISYTTQSDTLLEGTICFLPGCSFIGDLLEVSLTGIDTLDCSPSNWVYDTVYIRVDEPFNQPPVISHDLSGLELDGTTVLVEAGTNTCYTLILEDPDSISAELIANGVSEVFDSDFGNGNSAEITVSGTNPLNITVCWNPSCYEEGEEFDLRVCGRDTSRCDVLPDVCDVVTFRVKPCTILTQNVFTPNDDGINDVFLPYDLSGVEWYTIKIFDRWGVQIEEVENEPWNGKHGNRQCQAGVYYYIVEYQFYSAEGEPLRDFIPGWVTLFR